MTTSLPLLARKVRVRKLFLFVLTLLIAASLETGVHAQCSNVGGTTGTTMNPDDIPKFVNPLPIPARINAKQGGNFDMVMEEVYQDLLGETTLGTFDTKVWGYGTANGLFPASYPGPTFETMKDVPITAVFANNLPPTGQFLPVDPTMHMAHPEGMHSIEMIRGWYASGRVPTVAHLHGGHTESASDGLPEQWYTQGFAEKGAQFKKEKFTYHNDQEAGTLWYHDHALGITRLNVYAGLAGFYLLRDANENNLSATNVLPSGPYEIEIVIQDRLFDMEGQLFWPAYNDEVPYGDFIETPLPSTDFPDNGGPTALAEFFGNVILVNGKAWPKLQVEPRKYRFRLLNGSDSRFYILRLNSDGDMNRFDDEGEIMVIGTDDGLLPQPVLVNELAIAPGERYDVVIDFSTKDGQAINIINNGPDAPAGGFEVDEGDVSCFESTGQIMQFQINVPLNAAVPDASVTPASNLRPFITPLTATQINNPRQLVLFEGMDQYGRLQPMLGTMQEGSKTWFEPITENPMLNDVEVWEVYNATADAHPIHLHLVSFQILSRQNFTGVVNDKFQVQHNSLSGDPASDLDVAATYGTGGKLTVSSLDGPVNPPLPHETGWKDTFIVPPGTVGRVIARFDRPGRYVWHCHILSHEDHEMMRPFFVGNMPRKKGQFAKEGYALSDPFPNPVAIGGVTNISFDIPKELPVAYRITNSITGEIVLSSDTRFYGSGTNTLEISIDPLLFMQAGDYVFTIYSGEYYDFTRIKVR